MISHGMRSGLRSYSADIAHIGLAAVLAVMGAGVLLGLGHTVADVDALVAESGGRKALLHWTVAAILAGGTFAVSWWLARRARPVSPTIFLALLVASTVLLRWVLITAVEPSWSTDYLRYWDRAVTMAAEGAPTVSDIYRQRALLVAYPVELLFGPNAVGALKWANALLLLLTQLCAYDAIRRTASHQAAQAASVLFLASPLPAYAALIPSHDVWALFFLAGALWAATLTWSLSALNPRRWVHVVISGIVCGIFAYCLELQRSIGTLLCVALVVASALHLFATSRRNSESGPPRASLLWVAVLALALQPILSSGGVAAGVQASAKESAEVRMAMKYAAHGSAMSTGRSAWYARFDDRFRSQLSGQPEEVGDFARSIVLSTWTLQPLGKLDAMREHAGRLFSLSYPMDWDTLLRRPDGMDKSLRLALIIHIGIFGVLMLLATFVSLLVFAVRPTALPFPAAAGAILTVGVASVLLLLFENKPYNIAPVWMIYPLLVGPAFVAFHTRHQPQRDVPEKRALALAALGLLSVLVGGIAAVGGLRIAYSAETGMILDEWEVNQDQTGATSANWVQQLEQMPPQAFDPKHYVEDRRDFVLRDAPEDADRISQRADRLFLTLQFSPGSISRGDSITASRIVCAGAERNTLEFFMFAPYLRRDVEEAFTVKIALDGQLLEALPIPHKDRSDSMKRVSIADIANGDNDCRILSVSLVSNVDRTAQSWPRASHTEIWFPRLVD